MNRETFIRELEFLLQDIEDVEREIAVQYYEDYFDEAGIENEQQVIKELGTPEKVAAIIKAGLDNEFDQNIEYGENRMGNSSYEENQEIIEAKVIDEKDAEDNSFYKSHFKGNPDRNRILLIAIIIALIILLLPTGGAVFGLGIGFFAAIFGVGLAIFLGGGACFIGAIICFVKAIMIIAAYPGAGLLTLAAGFGLVALAFVFFVLAKLLIKIIPMVIRVIVNFCQSIIHKVGEY